MIGRDRAASACLVSLGEKRLFLLYFARRVFPFYVFSTVLPLRLFVFSSSLLLVMRLASASWQCSPRSDQQRSRICNTHLHSHTQNLQMSARNNAGRG